MYPALDTVLKQPESMMIQHLDVESLIQGSFNDVESSLIQSCFNDNVESSLIQGCFNDDVESPVILGCFNDNVESSLIQGCFIVGCLTEEVQ